MKKVNPEDLVNWWLEKYHNTNLKKVLEEHPEWQDDPKSHGRDFYEAYPVTEEQLNEWEKWAKDYTKKVTGIKGKLFDRSWGYVYLDTAPSLIKEIK
jgi:hypothetical protein